MATHPRAGTGAGPADPAGYSVFYIADYETARGYNPVYTEVRDYRKTGKQAPALIDYLNWNGQPGEELLIRVFGRTDSWYEAIALQNGKWQQVWESERTWEVPNEDDGTPRSYVLEMLPYPSGEPHMGHLKNYAVGDAVAHEDEPGLALERRDRLVGDVDVAQGHAAHPERGALVARSGPGPVGS